MKPQIKWLDIPDKHDYPAAASYLSLVLDPKTVKKIVAELRKAKVVKFKAKDIFRASGLSLLGVSNYHVEQDLKKITAGMPLSPLLLVRDPRSSKLIIADGYHRACACYAISEDEWIPCQIR